MNLYLIEAQASDDQELAKLLEYVAFDMLNDVFQDDDVQQIPQVVMKEWLPYYAQISSRPEQGIYEDNENENVNFDINAASEQLTDQQILS